MILDIDHVALCLESFEIGKKVLSELGYECKYSVYQKPNLIIKKKIMKNSSKMHDFALYKLKNCFGIEIINHEKINIVESRMIPIFENIRQDFLENSEQFDDFLRFRFKKINWIGYALNNQESFRFNKLIFKTNNLQASKRFWESFGFNSSQIKENMLEYHSILNSTDYQFFLQYDEKISKQKLDDSGLNCIAFISNSLEQEKRNLQNSGIGTTEIEEIEINEKVLKIFFCLGPTGELVEIISPIN